MSQAAQYSGLEAWASRIRHDLASATGMAEFTDRVQTRGFDWMSSFVNSVLNDETIVEIAKTPGRQKSAKKTRSRTAAVAASATKLKAINNGMYDVLEGKENALTSPTRGSARKMQRALLAARENGDSDEENYDYPRTVAPIKNLAFNVSPKVGGQKHTPKSKSKSGSPTRPPKSLLRSPNKPRPVANRESEKVDSEIISLPAEITAHTVLPRRHSPSPDRSMPGAPPHNNPFVFTEPTSRTPLAVLEECAELVPIAKTDELEAPWKPEPPRTLSLPAPSPMNALAVLPSSPMKIDDPSFEGPIRGSFQSVPLDSPTKSSISLPAQEQSISEEEDTENSPPQRVLPPPSPSLDPKNPPVARASLDSHHLRSEDAPASPHSFVQGDRRATPPQGAASTVDSSSAAVQLATDSHIAPSVNTHIDVVVPLNDGDGISRQSIFTRASQPARQSGGAGLRRSTFARSFAPRSRVVSSSAGDAAAAAMEVVNTSSAPTATPQYVPSQQPQSAKRKSDVLEVGDEDTPVDDVPRKIRKVEQSPVPTAVERDTEAKSVYMPSRQSTSASLVNPASDFTEVSPPSEPGTIVTPSVSETEVSSKTPLAQLAALAQGLTTGSRKTTSGSAPADPTSEPRRAPSLYPNTRTFDMRELMGGDYEPPASPKSDSERSPSESADFSDSITPDDGAHVHHPAEDALSEGDGVDHDDGGQSCDDVAITFNKDSFTPANSPPKSTMRTGYSVPEAMSEYATTSGERPTSIFVELDRSLEVNHNASVVSEQHSQVGSTSAASILSVAKAVVTNFFRPSAQQSAAPAAPAQVSASQSAATPPVANVPRPGAFNPFMMDLTDPRPTTIGVNPFLSSPAKPLPPPPPEEPQSAQQASQSTVFSSQASGASFFDSSHFMRRASYENPGYETDITESQFSQSQFGGAARLREVEDEPHDVAEVAAALAQASPDTSMQLRHSLAREDVEDVPKTSDEPTPASAAEPNVITTQATKVAPTPAKTLKHVQGIVSLSTKNKNDALKVTTQQGAKRGAAINGGPAKTTGIGKKDEADTRKREKNETAPNVGQSAKSKTEDEINKKRKLEIEIRLKNKQAPSIKNSSSMSQIGVSKQPVRPPFKSNLKPVSSMTASTSGVLPKMAGGLPTKSSALPSVSAMRPPPQPHINPQAQIQAKMQATLDAQIAKEKAALRVKAQAQQKSMHITHPEPDAAEEEEVELPDIASEYSNSDDEDRPSKILAEWAEPAELEKLLLRQQAEIDPDELFGEVGEPNLEAMFGPKNKFRVRSSSANWHSGDGLTAAESANYAKRMGWKRE